MRKNGSRERTWRRALERRRRRALERSTLRIRIRRTWGMKLAVLVARTPMPSRLKVLLAQACLRIPQIRAGEGPWQRLPFEVTP